jgi:hypothetical protein
MEPLEASWTSPGVIDQGSPVKSWLKFEFQALPSLSARDYGSEINLNRIPIRYAPAIDRNAMRSTPEPNGRVPSAKGACAQSEPVIACRGIIRG